MINGSRRSKRLAAREMIGRPGSYASVLTDHGSRRPVTVCQPMEMPMNDEQWQYQLRVYLTDALADGARSDRNNPALRPLTDILDVGSHLGVRIRFQ